MLFPVSLLKSHELLFNHHLHASRLCLPYPMGLLSAGASCTQTMVFAPVITNALQGRWTNACPITYLSSCSTSLHLVLWLIVPVPG